MKNFDEDLKRIFRDSSDQELMLCNLGGAVPDDVVKRVELGDLEITRQEMREVFNPVIQEILRLVREQIDTVALGSQDNVSVSSPLYRKRTLLSTLTVLMLVDRFIGGRVWVVAILGKAANRLYRCHISE